MITREKKLAMYILILPFIVIEDTILHENQNGVKVQCFFLTIVAISTTRSSKTPPGTFF